MTKEDAIWAAVYAHVWCTWPGASPYRASSDEERNERARLEANRAVRVYRKNKE